jgi:DMSO reductase family type II enzyme heme b subunit
MYTSGPRDDGARPTATVRLLRRGSGETFVRLEWTDATAQQLRPGQRLPDVGEEHVYHAQTEGTADFADAACVMLPQQRQAASPGPSITMGDKTTPVDLYYWRAGGGFQVLKASGISTITDTGTAGSGGAVRTKTGWSVVFSVGNAPARTPITFAIWDGAKQHRDGIKYFSLWCEVG